MTPLLNQVRASPDFTFTENENYISLLDGSETMRNRDDGHAALSG
jgi:hypothetical protein